MMIVKPFFSTYYRCPPVIVTGLGMKRHYTSLYCPFIYLYIAIRLPLSDVAYIFFHRRLQIQNAEKIVMTCHLFGMESMEMGPIHVKKCGKNLVYEYTLKITAIENASKPFKMSCLLEEKAF